MSKAPVHRKHNNDATKGTDTELSTAAGGDESLTAKTDDSLDQNLDGDDSQLGVEERLLVGATLHPLPHLASHLIPECNSVESGSIRATGRGRCSPHTHGIGLQWLCVCICR